jgi:hypothetical protein
MRMVLFVMPGGQIRPAIIHDVHSDICVSLTVFPGANDASLDITRRNAEAVERRSSVMQDQDGKAPSTWHWNEHQIQSGKPSH